MVNQTTIGIRELLVSLEQANIKLWVQGGKLRSKAPKGAITPLLRSQISFHQGSIIKLIQAAQKQVEELPMLAIPKIVTQENYVLSNAQRRIWILDQMEDNQIAYNMPMTIELSGNLDVKALEQAFQLLFERHESLRTNFVGGKQVIGKSAFQLKVQYYTKASQQDIEQVIDQHARFAFDLEKDSLLQLTLLQLKEVTYLLLFNMHHIISDGWSLTVLFRELSNLYAACHSGVIEPLSVLPQLPIQYKEYAAWQNDLVASEQIVPIRQFWLETLAPDESSNLPLLDLPTDYPRPIIKTYNGASSSHTFEAPVQQALKDLSQTQGATLFMTLTALVNILLHRYTHQTDILLGTPSAGRTHPDLQHQIGFYINTLVLRNQIQEEDSFITFLERVKQTALAAYDNELYPFDQLVEELAIPRDTSRSAVFDVMLALENTEQGDLVLGDLKVNIRKREIGVSKFDLMFNFSESKEGLQLEVEYNTDLFKAATIERLLSHLATLIASVLSEPQTAIKELNIIPIAEKTLLLETFNDTAIDYPKDKTIVDLFEVQVAKEPDNIAVVFEDKQLTYEQLNQKANQLAHYLHQQYDTKGDDIIALQLERSEWMIIAILGVLKSGAAYLPIAPDLPKARVQYMLDDSKAKALLTDTATFEIVKELEISVDNVETIKYKQHIRNPKSDNRNASNLAYIIYTSGSTGQPKGVMIEHSGVINMSLSQINRFGISSDDVVLQFANYTFDAAVYELLMAWFSGAALVMANSKDLQQPKLLLNIIDNFNINIGILPPTYLSTLLNLDKERFLKQIKVLITAGESPILEDVQWLVENSKKQDFSYINAYGPTEYSVCISTFGVPPSWSNTLIPIGQPIANTEVYILDNHNAVQPLGIAGELCVSGAGLARGYLNKPQLTAEKFISHPFKEGERLYKTGDLARWLPDGNIEFLGRIDYQLKIRGYRIEAGEIEQVLLSKEAIQSAIVVGYDYDIGKELVAYLVPKAGHNIPDVSALRTYLGKTLPYYMIPSHFVALETLPLTSSGKVNSKALPKPDTAALRIGTTYVAPRNSIESQLVDIWQSVLNRENIGIHDNFFIIGGHSLRAIRLVALIQEQLTEGIKLAQVFSHPTIASLAEEITQLRMTNLLQEMSPSAEKQNNVEEIEEIW